nr:MAG TPA: hypothetical protein [Caudoviricetes sp.]
MSIASRFVKFSNSFNSSASPIVSFSGLHNSSYISNATPMVIPASMILIHNLFAFNAHTSF